MSCKPSVVAHAIKPPKNDHGHFWVGLTNSTSTKPITKGPAPRLQDSTKDPARPSDTTSAPGNPTAPMPHGGLTVLYGQRIPQRPLQHSVVTSSVTASPANTAAAIPLDLTDFKRDLSELTDRLGQAQDCL